jgi:hypothetical protein
VHRDHITLLKCDGINSNDYFKADIFSDAEKHITTETRIRELQNEEPLELSSDRSLHSIVHIEYRDTINIEFDGNLIGRILEDLFISVIHEVKTILPIKKMHNFKICFKKTTERLLAEFR